jgi:hypothetical protein
MKIHPVLTLVTVSGLLLAGCGLSANRQPGNSPSIVFTAAALTVDAQLAQSVLSTPVISPATEAPVTGLTSTATVSSIETDTPSPDATVSAGPTAPCDAAKFMADVTIPDHTRLSADASFTKTWRLENIGSCAWDPSYTLVFDSGDQMGGPASQPLPESVAPGRQVEISVVLQAPSASGNYRGFWRLRNPSGVLLPVADGYNNKSFYVDIQVTTNGSVPKFIVSDVTFKVSHSGSCSSGTYTVTAKVTTNGAGEVSYMWRRSDGVVGALNDGTLTFSAAGTQSISYDWPSGATGLSMSLYIDNPNKHEFGTALLNCP